MWHIVIQKSSGKVVREIMEDKPSSSNLEYWEEYYSDTEDYKYYAVVINVFETEE